MPAAARSDRSVARRLATVVVALAVVGVGAGCTSAASTQGSSPSATTVATASATTPSASARPARAVVIYRVTGGAPAVSIRYGNKHHTKTVETTLPWSHTGSAFTGTTVILAAHQPRSRYGFRLLCTLSVTIPGSAPLVSRDSSHIVGIKEEGGPQKILYDGLCNTAEVVSLTGLP